MKKYIAYILFLLTCISSYSQNTYEILSTSNISPDSLWQIPSSVLIADSPGGKTLRIPYSNNLTRIVLPVNYSWSGQHYIEPSFDINLFDENYWRKSKATQADYCISLYFSDVNNNPLTINIEDCFKYRYKKTSNWEAMSAANTISRSPHYQVMESHELRTPPYNAPESTILSNVLRLDSIVIESYGGLSIKPNISINRASRFGLIKPTLDKAKECYAQNNFDGAIRLTTEIIEDNNFEDFEPYYIRANSYYELGYYRSAIIDWNNALRFCADAKSKQMLNLYIGKTKLSLDDPTCVENLAHAGHDGRIILQELGVNPSKPVYPQITTSKDSIPSQQVLNGIARSSSQKTLTPSEIYSLRNPAVFTIIAQSDESTSQGSAFFIGENGLAISNYHVFEGCDPSYIYAILPNGGTFQIKEVLGYSKEKDFIIFRVNGNGFTYIPISTNPYNIGDEVFAIGSPKGERNILSQGLISGIGHSETTFRISVPIDHGSSGGVLLNKYGEAIGITSGGRDDTQANLNYAIDLNKILFE